jgi:cytochrome c nitrite reductase small subunit
MVPQYATWRHSSHKEVANCVDCHVPHNNIFNQYFFKAKDGFNHAKLFTLRAERQAIIIGSEGEKAVQQNCIRCHENLLDRSKIKSKTSNKYIAHNKNRKCWDCHKEVPHGKNRSLSSTPHAIVPKLESPVPDWLKSFVKK